MGTDAYYTYHKAMLGGSVNSKNIRSKIQRQNQKAVVAISNSCCEISVFIISVVDSVQKIRPYTNPITQ